MDSMYFEYVCVILLRYMFMPTVPVASKPIIVAKYIFVSDKKLVPCPKLLLVVEFIINRGTVVP